MAREKFIEHKFSQEKLDLLVVIARITADYQRQGYKLSLRQLYYQLVSKAVIPNTVNSYKAIGSLVSDARNAGLIDWNMIEDRGRETVSNSHWTSPAEIMRAAASSFRIDKWATQPYHIEIMVEKDALSGVLEPVARRLDIRITANKGYSSSSMMYTFGKRLKEKSDAGKKICIIYLGDHDPSGIDMTRDVDERLALYSGLDSYEVKRLEVARLALNYDQVQLWNPPRNPAKESDSRFQRYADQFGESSWELDAVEPATLASLVTAAVEARRDAAKWRAANEQEQAMRDELEGMAQEYEDEHPEDEEDYEPDEDDDPDDEEGEDEEEESLEVLQAREEKSLDRAAKVRAQVTGESYDEARAALLAEEAEDDAESDEEGSGEDD